MPVSVPSRVLLGSCVAFVLLASACGSSTKTAMTATPLFPSPLVAGGYGDAGGQSCLLTRRHRVECWGDNGWGQLGDGTMAGSGPVYAKGLANVDALAMNGNSACALVREGRVACWGFETHSSFGYPEKPTTSYPVPTYVKGVAHASAVSATGGNGCAIVTGGRVVCWGADGSDGTMRPGRFGPYGRRNLPPRPVAGVKDAIRLSYGDGHICALIKGGSVSCWGNNDAGESGHGAVPPAGPQEVTVRPGLVPGIATAIAVSAGDASTCALLSDHTVRCWGDNAYGELGNRRPSGPRAEHESPVAVDGISNATAISVGSDHACAIVSGGHVWCWGGNGNGQLGDGRLSHGQSVNPGAPDFSPLPVEVRGLTDAVAIAAGSWHTCALLRSGTVECWGSDAHGQLGDGRKTDSATPVTVKGVRY